MRDEVIICVRMKVATSSALFRPHAPLSRFFDNALTDGVLILRTLFGLREEPLVGNAIDNNPTRGSSSAIAQYLRALTP